MFMGSSITMMSIFPRLIYRFNAIPTKCKWAFEQIYRLILNFVWKQQKALE